MTRTLKSGGQGGFQVMNIKTIVALPVSIVVAATAIVLLALAVQSSIPVHAAETDNKDKKAETSKEVTYVYVAQPGDSYSKMARKAVQTYGLKHKVDLSQSRIMYAETHLTQEAYSPELIQGQKVEIKESAIKSWVDKAKDLSKDQVTKWDKYTIGVNFNTDNVGEARS